MVWSRRKKETFSQNRIKKKNSKKMRRGFKDVWDIFKCSNIRIIGEPEGEEEEQEIENLFEKIMTNNFPNLAKEIDFQEVLQAQRVPKKLEPRKHTARHIIITLVKIKDKERILKAAREEVTVTYKGLPTRHKPISQKKPCRQERAGKKHSKS